MARPFGGHALGALVVVDGPRRAAVRNPEKVLGQRDVAQLRAPRRKPRRRVLDRMLGLGLGGVPQRRAAQSDFRGGADRRRGAGLRPSNTEVISSRSSMVRAIKPIVSRPFGCKLETGAVESPERRLVADHPTIGRRPQHRAAGLGAERRRNHQISDSGA